MPRPLRLNLPNLIYHVLNRGNNKQKVFNEDADYRKFLDILQKYKTKFDFKVFAYCLMDNHIHLLLKTSEQGTLSEIMQAITISHTMSYHFKKNTTGHIWTGRFKSPVVSDDEYLLTVMKYIEQNPVRAGLVEHPGEYPYSSFHSHINIRDDALVDKEENPVYTNFGSSEEERASRYNEFMTKILEEEKLELMRKSLNGLNHFMSDRFREQVNEKIRMKEKRTRGRPRNRN